MDLFIAYSTAKTLLRRSREGMRAKTTAELMIRWGAMHRRHRCWICAAGPEIPRVKATPRPLALIRESIS
jgi:hypothetical protein